MNAVSADIKRVVLVRLNPGDDVLLSLRQAVRDEQIENGVLLNGLGSTSSFHYHVVADTNLPPAEAYPQGDAPRDIVCFSGLIIGGRVHAHITLSDDTKAEGGHLEEGTRVLTFCVIAIADLGDIQIAGWDSIGEVPDANV